MKKFLYIMLIVISALVLTTCRKRPELKIYNLELSEETVVASTNGATITANYFYPGEIPTISLFLSTNSAMTSAVDYNATVSESTITATVDNLVPNTKYFYYFRYSNGINLINTETKNFTTEGYTLPEVSTGEISEVASNSAHCGGEVTSVGNGTLSAVGICYATRQNPNLQDNVINCGDTLGVFDVYITNLDINTQYYVRAFATNQAGTAYGEQKTFTTLGQVPTLVTIPITSVTSNSAVSGGTVTDNGGNAVVEKGVCWSTNEHPTISDSHTSDGSGNGAFVSNLTELLPNTLYYVRAYATNSEGTGYGNELFFTTSASLAVLTTKTVTNITQTTATCGGNITNSGGMDITARGVCWSTNHNPTTNDNHTEDGTGIGEFDSEITSLSANVKYYVRAYATSDYGTSYGNEVEFTTTMGMPTVSTKSVTGITASSASCGGEVTNSGGGTISARGVCWSTSQSPTISDSHTTDGTGTGEFTSSITGLNNNVTYYVRAYATNENGTAYGEENSFTTQEGLAVVTTTDITNITATSASSGGEITDDGGYSITARGVCWSTSQNPTISDAHTFDGTGIGSYTSSLTSLTYNTTYYVRAYATNTKGTSYGEEKAFTTNKLTPTVTTAEDTSITSNSAVSGGNVTSDGGAAVTARGICWSTSQNPTISGIHTTDGNGTGEFISNLTGLEENTTYYVRAYATNSEGTNYGSQKTFTTSQNVVLPTVTTNEVSNVSTTSASCGGNITSAGYGTVSARGVCWSSSQNPTVNNSHTSDGTGTGVFTSSITGLTENTTYYVRAYATNEAGTNYGAQKAFTTPHATMLPTVTTNNVTEITQTTAISGGNVTSAGYGTVSDKGVCWSTSQNPTISDTHTSDGTGTGEFTSSITGLTNNTTYYVRAYATNEAGTAYGEQKTFTTEQGIILPTIITTEITQITPYSAVTGGDITSTGNGTIYARGVCWNTTQNPTTLDSFTTDGMGGGSFISTLSNLTENTTYYLRAYAINEAGTSYGEQLNFTTPIAGAINGLFSVSDNKQVYFSQGNLQYQASTNTWRFADNQWDYVGSTVVETGTPGGTVAGSSNHLISEYYEGWIDLFGYGTSGYDGGYYVYPPYSISESVNNYPKGNLTQYSDWGYNSISNGGNVSGIWRTLTNNEWVYVFETRATLSGIRYAKAVVNNVNGVIILPDSWNSGTYSINNFNQSDADYSNNTISSTLWTSIFEANGAVFIPASGNRRGTNVNWVNHFGAYWSSTGNPVNNWYGSYTIYFTDTEFDSSWGAAVFVGLSVRLVQNL